MSYPTSKEQIPDTWDRGRVSMFADIVEYRNRNPEAISDKAIEDIYHMTVEGHCKLTTKLSVVVGGEEITE